MKPEWETRLIELTDLSVTELGWEPPATVAIENARLWLSKQDGCVPLYIFPSVDGGIHVEFEVMSLDLWADFQNDGQVDIGGVFYDAPGARLQGPSFPIDEEPPRKALEDGETIEQRRDREEWWHRNKLILRAHNEAGLRAYVKYRGHLVEALYEEPFDPARPRDDEEERLARRFDEYVDVLAGSGGVLPDERHAFLAVRAANMRALPEDAAAGLPAAGPASSDSD